MSKESVSPLLAAINCEEELHNYVPSLLGLSFKALYNEHNEGYLEHLEWIASISDSVRALWFYVDPPLYSPKEFHSMQCAEDLLKNTRLLHEQLSWTGAPWICVKRAKRKCTHEEGDNCKPFFIINSIEDTLEEEEE